MTLLYTYSFNLSDVLINTRIFLQTSESRRSFEKEREHGIVYVFLFLNNSLATWYLIIALVVSPSCYLLFSLILYKPTKITLFFSAIEQEYNRFNSSILRCPSSTIPTLNKHMYYWSWANFWRVFVSIILIIWLSTFFLTSNEILFDQSTTKGLLIGRYLPVHLTTYRDIIAANIFTNG